jgi:hypothetical protein
MPGVKRLARRANIDIAGCLIRATLAGKDAVALAALRQERRDVGGQAAGLKLTVVLRTAVLPVGHHGSGCVPGVALMLVDEVVRYSNPLRLKWPFGLFRRGDEVEIRQGTGLKVIVAEDCDLPASP